METYDYKYSELTGKIIGSAMKIHSALGPGFPEIVYKRCLIVEMEKLGFTFESEVEKDIYYEAIWVGKRRLDLLVENKILIELKAVAEVDNACHHQIINYLKLFEIEIGLLLNFGTASLQFKRFIYSK